MKYDQCNICCNNFKSGEIKAYYIKNEPFPFFLCDKCVEFILNLYFGNMRMQIFLERREKINEEKGNK